jgi:NADH:ubiquinone oxidoreductase subunit F (NADH-binding)
MSVQRLLDPNPVRSLDEHRAVGGLIALEEALRVEPEVAISVVTDAGLRGRGGAGFPTGEKWSTVATNAASSELAPTVVVNAAEGEPGTFGDRTLIRRNPYRVLEGALIAAHAIGARAIAVVTKDRYTTELGLLTDAAQELVATGGAGDVDIEVIGGAGHYLLGEETALLEAAAGRPPFPRVAPPYRHGTVEMGEAGSGASRVELAGEGGAAPPTLVNNAQTFAHVPLILHHGPDWFRELGTADSPGTALFTVTGDVRRGGVAEYALGTPLRTIIDEIGGGTVEADLAFVMSGVSVGILRPEHLDLPATYEDLSAVGSGLGTGGFTVYSRATDPMAVAHGVSRFLAIESCGQCRPCKEGGLEVAAALDLLREGQASETAVQDLLPLVATLSDGARCDLGPQHERVITSFLEQFPESARAHTVDRIASPAVLVAPITDIDDEGRVTLDEDHRTKQPDWEHGEDWNGQTPADRYDVAVTIE